MILTRVRSELPRDERTRPETVICRCEFEEWTHAQWTARQWSGSHQVRAGTERVKTVAVDQRSPGPGRSDERVRDGGEGRG